jgi:membrane-associated protease RseP (regulator of RpoE activity)
MSRRGTILLAVGLLIAGLICGALGGMVTGRFLARRSFARFAPMRMTPGAFGRGMMPYFAPRGFAAPYASPRGRSGPMPFYGPRGGFGAMPYYGSGRGFGGRAPFFGRRGLAPRAPRSNFANGALVNSIESNSPADKAGLKAGDVIITVAGSKIDAAHSLASLLQTHKPGDKIDLGVTRSGQSMTISVTLGAAPQNSNTAYLGIRFGPAPGSQQPRPNLR